MRTLSSIKQKAEKLKGAYRAEVRRRGYRENMGDKYIDMLEDYLSCGNTTDLWGYPCSDRQAIIKIQDELFDVVTDVI